MPFGNIFIVLDAMGINTPLKRIVFLVGFLALVLFVAPLLMGVSA